MVPLILSMSNDERVVERRIHEDNVKMVLPEGEVIPQKLADSIAYMSF